MTVTITTIRFGFAALLGVALSSGCKNKDTDGGVAKGGRNDPLLSGPGRIAPQNLPVPERGTAGGRRSDPLLGSPTTRPNERSGYTDDAERFKGVFVPNANSGPAALAGRMREGDELKMERPDGTDVRPVGGTLPPASSSTDSQLIALETYGVKRGDYSLEQDGSGSVLRVRKELSGGGVRQYTETGATPAEALGKMIEHIKSDGR